MDKEKLISRRKFFSRIGKGSILTVLSGSAVIIYKYLFPNVLYEPSPVFKAGYPNDFTIGSSVFFKDRKLFLFHDEAGFYAMSAVCTHLGCLVNKTQDGFFCPCHGSVFDSDGIVIKGPAPRRLPTYSVEIAPGGRLQIDLTKIVDEKYRLKT
ncbi:MAG: ubiquinol-cytochrome c reductase iron-sulfur subunit [Candidatus Aminicenantales bacterium]